MNYEELKVRISNIDGPLLWQLSNDPHKRIWELDVDELIFALKEQEKNIGYIPKHSSANICCVCLKGHPSNNCDKFPEDGGKCTICKKITYCSKSCQKKDAERHKKYCKK